MFPLLWLFPSQGVVSLLSLLGKIEPWLPLELLPSKKAGDLFILSIIFVFPGFSVSLAGSSSSPTPSVKRPAVARGQLANRGDEVTSACMSPTRGGQPGTHWQLQGPAPVFQKREHLLWIEPDGKDPDYQKAEKAAAVRRSFCSFWVGRNAHPNPKYIS